MMYDELTITREEIEDFSEDDINYILENIDDWYKEVVDLQTITDIVSEF